MARMYRYCKYCPYMMAGLLVITELSVVFLQVFWYVSEERVLAESPSSVIAGYIVPSQSVVNGRLEEDQRERLYQIRKHCQDFQPNTIKGFKNIILEESSRVAYCSTHKIASTFWTQVFLFANSTIRFSKRWKSPFDVSKFDVHLGPLARMLHFQSMEDTLRHTLNFTRFMFVRNPYERLWSVYLDKVIIIDYHFNKFYLSKMFGSDSYSYCADITKITFVDFLTFVVNMHNETQGSMDDHFGHIDSSCDPCVFKPNFIGKFETFARDSQYILSLLGLDNFEQSGLKARALQEMFMLTDYNVFMFKSICEDCFVLCLQRMITAFGLNGYLSPQSVNRLQDAIFNLNFSMSISGQLKSDIETEFRKLERNTFEIHVTSSRKEHIIAAYKQIPKELLESVRKLYLREFSMFGYDYTF